MRTQFSRRVYKAVFVRLAKLFFRMRDQQFHDFWRQLHMTLKTVNPIAVSDDLARAAFAVSDDRGIRRQARHVVMPVSDLQLSAKMAKQHMLLSGLGERDRKLANLSFRAVLKSRAQRFANQL